MTQAKDNGYDIIIGGGSFVGLALALALARSAPGMFRIAAIERRPPDEARSGAFDGRAVALTAAARHMLDVLGLWPALAPRAQPVTAIDITDSGLEMPVRSVLLHFDTALNAEEPAAFIVENALLRRVLFEAVEQEASTEVLAPEAIRAMTVDESGVTATLESGAGITARLLVAADGQRSALRRMAGIKVVEWDAAQTGIVATIAHDRPHGGRAVQHFLPAGPFAVLPMTDNRCSLVWTETADEARRLLALEDAALIGEIERRMGRQLGALRLVSRPSGYPLVMTLARSFVKPRFALAGDAAHGLHWIAGQGLNHGLKDAAALAEVLTDAARLGLDIGQLPVLERYERWRRFDSASSAMAAAALNRLFSNDFAPLRLVRDFGLGVVDRVPPLKRFFVAEAAGLTGEVPRLLKGEAI